MYKYERGIWAVKHIDYSVQSYKQKQKINKKSYSTIFFLSKGLKIHPILKFTAVNELIMHAQKTTTRDVLQCCLIVCRSCCLTHYSSNVDEDVNERFLIFLKQAFDLETNKSSLIAFFGLFGIIFYLNKIQSLPPSLQFHLARPETLDIGFICKQLFSESR